MTVSSGKELYQTHYVLSHSIILMGLLTYLKISSLSNFNSHSIEVFRMSPVGPMTSTV